ncbi:MAG: hypothetical protein JWL71_3259 [Acidobacteria bacterium]|nr:hypothetical protein [Acidobacteriota bacterium]
MWTAPHSLRFNWREEREQDDRNDTVHHLTCRKL